MDAPASPCAGGSGEGATEAKSPGKAKYPRNMRHLLWVTRKTLDEPTQAGAAGEKEGKTELWAKHYALHRSLDYAQCKYGCRVSASAKSALDHAQSRLGGTPTTEVLADVATHLELARMYLGRDVARIKERAKRAKEHEETRTLCRDMADVAGGMMDHVGRGVKDHKAFDTAKGELATTMEASTRTLRCDSMLPFRALVAFVRMGLATTAGAEAWDKAERKVAEMRQKAQKAKKDGTLEAHLARSDEELEAILDAVMKRIGEGAEQGKEKTDSRDKDT